MTLKNSKGTERSVQILFEVEKNKKKYVVYKDPHTNNMYGGRLTKKKVKPLTDEELVLLDTMVKKIER